MHAWQGWFHELGHEAQRRPDKSTGWDNHYTFHGSVEATVNIFTVAAIDALGLTFTGGWSWVLEDHTTMDTALTGLSGGQTYASVDVGYKLAMHLQLSDAFGWAAWTNVFDQYYTAAPVDLPVATDEAERNQFYVRWSNTVRACVQPCLGAPSSRAPECPIRAARGTLPRAALVALPLPHCSCRTPRAALCQHAPPHTHTCTNPPSTRTLWLRCAVVCAAAYRCCHVFAGQVEYDLAPFFSDVWGLDLSAESRAAVAHYPLWCVLHEPAVPWSSRLIPLVARHGCGVAIAFFCVFLLLAWTGSPSWRFRSECPCLRVPRACWT